MTLPSVRSCTLTVKKNQIPLFTFALKSAGPDTVCFRPSPQSQPVSAHVSRELCAHRLSSHPLLPATPLTIRTSDTISAQSRLISKWLSSKFWLAHPSDLGHCREQRSTFATAVFVAVPVGRPTRSIFQGRSSFCSIPTFNRQASINFSPRQRKAAGAVSPPPIGAPSGVGAHSCPVCPSIACHLIRLQRSQEPIDRGLRYQTPPRLPSLLVAICRSAFSAIF
jgi:hypothetical protein